MASEWGVQGVPRALSVDMWWLAEMTDGISVPTRRQRSWQQDGAAGRVAALLALILLADVLFYGQAPGLSLAVFAAAVLAATMALTPGQEQLRPALLLLVAALPVVEHVQALSLAFLAAGLLASLAWATGGRKMISARMLRFARELPWRGFRDAVILGCELAEGGVLSGPRRRARAWAFPLGGAVILIGLLIEANPVLEEALFRLLQLDLGEGDLFRPVFWLGVGLMIWPLIAPQTPGQSLVARPALRLPGPNALSVARGLVLFNAILAVQTVLDLTYLWGGASLPEGMNAAEYAHRGAYPLLLTALLAGGFALAARPFAREDRRLRLLLLVWLAQNLALTVSALLRLDVYVEAFGLTYLRVHASIWMALVAAGLGLTAWQVWRGLPNGWLVRRSAALGMATLYVACFVNFAAIIAAQNLAREKFDGSYVCSLGPSAAAEIVASRRDVQVYAAYGEALGPCAAEGPVTKGWRDWGFRNWRVRRYLERVAVPEAVDEDTRRG